MVQQHDLVNLVLSSLKGGRHAMSKTTVKQRMLTSATLTSVTAHRLHVLESTIHAPHLGLSAGHQPWLALTRQGARLRKQCHCLQMQLSRPICHWLAGTS